MTTRLRHFGAKATVLAYNLQDHPDRVPRVVATLAAWRLVPSLQRQIEVLARLARILRRDDGPAFRYLDLSVEHLEEREREVILSTRDDEPDFVGVDRPLLPRIVPHRYGAWVQVSLHLDDDEDGSRLRAAGYPSLANVLAFAFRRGCRWINFHTDAEDIPELPHYEERAIPFVVASRHRRRQSGT